LVNDLKTCLPTSVLNGKNPCYHFVWSCTRHVKCTLDKWMDLNIL